MKFVACPQKEAVPQGFLKIVGEKDKDEEVGGDNEVVGVVGVIFVIDGVWVGVIGGVCKTAAYVTEINSTVKTSGNVFIPLVVCPFIKISYNLLRFYSLIYTHNY